MSLPSLVNSITRNSPSSPTAIVPSRKVVAPTTRASGRVSANSVMLTLGFVASVQAVPWAWRPPSPLSPGTGEKHRMASAHAALRRERLFAIGMPRSQAPDNGRRLNGAMCPDKHGDAAEALRVAMKRLWRSDHRASPECFPKHTPQFRELPRVLARRWRSMGRHAARFARPAAPATSRLWISRLSANLTGRFQRRSLHSHARPFSDLDHFAGARLVTRTRRSRLRDLRPITKSLQRVASFHQYPSDIR